MNRLKASWVAMLLASTLPVAAAPAQRAVEVTTNPGAGWQPMPTRTLDDLPPEFTKAPASTFDKYGGWISRKSKATGFFYVKKIDGRWWLIDPDGCLFIDKGMSSVKTTDTTGALAALKTQFGSQTNWAQDTGELLRANGFNSLGAWSDDEMFHAASRQLVHTKLLSFMAAYGKKRGDTYQQPGHTGYPNNCPFIFDPGFEKFCDEYARQLAAGKNDPWLLGYFSDNELPWTRAMLENYLSLPRADSGHQAALDWLKKRHGVSASKESITAGDKEDFLAFASDRYFRLVSEAIRKYDPNHLYLGARFYGATLKCPEVFRACGPYVNVVSVNYYNAWTPKRALIEMWARESGKPILITEWYAKAMDSGMPNASGAGWLVKTQRERGMFYQNFTLGLLESKVCVGWDWFKYMDNDPSDKTVDPSNRDSNKGIVNNRYKPYAPLLDAMQQLNKRVYSLTECFDKQTTAGLLPADNSLSKKF